MPLPSPKGKEKRGDFVSRCIGDKTTAKDFPDQKQRIAICYSQWDKAKKASGAVIGSGDNEVLIEAAQKTYGGKKRSELKDSDFLFPETRSFPIVSPQDIVDAIRNFGRMSGGMSYDEFIKKLYKKAKSKGQAFVNAIPESTKKEHNLKATEEEVIETKEVEQIQPEPSEEQADSQLTQPESEPEPEVQACDEEAYGEKKMVNIEIEVNINKNQDENNEEDNDEEGEEEDSQDNPSEELQEIVCPECGNSPCTCDTENDQADSNEVKTDETNESEAEYYANDLIKKLGISCVKESDAGLEAMRPSEDPYFQNKVYSKPGDLKN